MSSAADDPVLVLTTIGAGADADALARTLVEERLAACVNVLPPMMSHYRWQGQVEEDAERQLVMKTVRGQIGALEARLRELHPYELPEFLVIAVDGGSEGYLKWLRGAVTGLLIALLSILPAWAQTSGVAVEAAAGWAGFVDESLINHLVLGGSARVPLGARVGVGPEIVYMRGPNFDRDLFVTGNLTFDLLSSATRRAVVPYLVIGAGGFRHSDRFGTQDFASWEGAVTGGGGARMTLTPRVYALADARIGWELHVRITGGVGIVLE